MSYSNEKSVTVLGGIGLLDALFLLFLGLKLGGVIDWSWWWVTAPLWGQLALAIVFCVLAVIFFLAFRIVEAIRDKNLWGR